jgi:hypothetical protein
MAWDHRDKLLSGAGLRKRLVQLAHQVDLHEPLRLPSYAPSRAVKGAVDTGEAEARAPRVATKLMDWDSAHVGPSLLQ